jgi:hypothetical protein
MNSTPRLFLFFRRGIPLLGIALSLALAATRPASLGWALIASVALMAELGATFHSGKLYLSKRPAIILWEGYWLKMLRPILGLFGLEEALIRSFCEWNNQRVLDALQEKKHVKKLKPMLLLPHCIQATSCKAPVADNLQSCHRCGRCAAESVADGAAKMGWHAIISPRSRAAYADARKFHPNIIVAVACPDRLVKGLVNLPEIPSFAIPLELPHGMCIDTAFDIERLSAIMDAFAGEGRAQNIQPLKISGASFKSPG